jgi:serine/threonine protein kinase
MTELIERLLIGRTLVGRYVVEDVIGRGGMSIVYCARDNRLDREVALKIISFSPELEASERGDLRQRLRREAEAAARISSHPNVVQIYDYGTDEELDLDFIAMERLNGVDLKAALRGKLLGPKEARRVLLEASRGVAAGHRAGIVHRDVKPANVFLLMREQNIEMVKILDFGIAKALQPGLDGEDLTRTGGLPHSPAYASPEQLDPTRPVTPASDVYQLGLLAYEVLVGAKPFAQEERDRIRVGRAVPIPETGDWLRVPEPVRATIARALEIEPARRFADAGEFASAFESATADDVLSHRAATLAAPLPDQDSTLFVPSPTPVAKASRRKPALAAAAGLGALAILWSALQSSSRGPDVDEEPGAAGTAQVAATAERDEEFRPLMMQAFAALQESVSEMEGEDAAAAVQEAIGEIQQSLVHGNLQDHLSFYAEAVDFRESGEETRERIGDIRGRLMERYPEREISIDNLAIEFVGPGRARAIVDRSWRFEGDEVDEGSAREEMVLEKQGDFWLVVSEKELERFPAEER